MYIHQHQINNLQRLVQPGKVIVIYGARQVGKTTLVNKFLQMVDEEASKILFVNGDDIIVRQMLASQSIDKLRDFIGAHTLLVIDEAQYIEKIGLNLKLIVDHIPAVKIIATGSSSFDLAKDVGEPLTGRKFTLTLFPLAQMELSQVEKLHETQANLESRLIYGAYPKVVTTRDDRFREEYLHEMVSAYLFKDIFELEGVRHANKLVRLLQLLAFQIGKDVSLNELGTQLEMSKNTVERYLNLLEKIFVVYRRSAFSRHLRKEITKNQRYYFHDNGIRNALIRNFNPIAIRDDVGALWENYIITERMKKQEYLREKIALYFWRTYNKAEIDLVEEAGGQLHGFEIKWNRAGVSAPKDWKTQYPQARFEVIHRDNYLGFIS